MVLGDLAMPIGGEAASSLTKEFQMRRLTLMLLPLAAGIALPAHSAQWGISTSCSITAPGEDPHLVIVAQKRTNDEGETSSILRVRVDTASPILENRELVRDTSIEVLGHGEFAELDARGSVHGDVHRVTINATGEPELLRAIARGATININIPAPSGTQALTFDLIGSAAAVRHLAPCLE